VVLLAACAEHQSPLNSDRIREKFGSYGVEVLRADSQRRISNLYSGGDSNRVCRPLAIVDFARPLSPTLKDAHALIVAGGSIGEVFRAAGWTIHKTSSQIGEQPLPDLDIDIPALMQIQRVSTLATNTYQFELEKNGRRYIYAVISEIYHPDYLTYSELASIILDGH
jgi:hypothetical protein